MIIYTIHEPDPEHLIQVKEEMLLLGSPKIRVVNCGDYFQALEGTHRLTASYELGIKPELEIFEEDMEIDITLFDWYYANYHAFEDGKFYKASYIASELFDYRSSIPYNFD